MTSQTAVQNFPDLLRQAQHLTLWSGYVQAQQPDQKTLFEYRNMGSKEQHITAVLLQFNGTLASPTPWRFTLAPNEFWSLDASRWARECVPSGFSGQLVLLIEDSPGVDPKTTIAPAVTSHWRASSSYCEVAAQGFRHINTREKAGKTSFFMFCPAVVNTPEKTTVIVLFNHSSDPEYRDTVEIAPLLCGLDGRQIEGRPLHIPPFGAMQLNVATHFGPEGEALLKKSEGRGSLSISHMGHIFPCYFFHIDRQTGDVLDGQHTQPPSTVLHHPGIWWGRLRQLVV